jgi:hypothetical protein
MAKKALIVYASITGNTEKVAYRIRDTIEKKGQPWGDWTCDISKVTKNSDKRQAPYNAADYDLFIVGAPIWAGTPPLYLFDDHLGALGAYLMPKGMLMQPGGPGGMSGPAVPGAPPPEMPNMNAGYKTKTKGIIFVTYGGQGQGPLEAQAALTCLELRLDGAMIKTVGKFACCGKMWEEPTVDPIAAKYGWMVGDATVAIAMYKENPNAPEFAKLTAEERKLFEKAVKMTEVYSSGALLGGRAFHWDYTSRPRERDLLRAEIFMSDVLEDYYGGGIEMYPWAQYLSIS